MTAPIELVLDADDDRWDRAIRRALLELGHDASVREIRAGLKSGAITIDGGRRAPGERATAGARIRVATTLRAEAKLVGDDALAARVTRLHEDDDLLVLAKPSGVPTVPIHADERTGTLLHAAIALAPVIADAGPPLEGGAVHRLDTGTSGVVLFAKSRAVRAAMRQAFRAHEVEKQYDALVDGDLDAVFAAGPVTVTAALVNAGKRMRVSESDDALDAVSIVERIDGDHVRVTTRFGRRHQVRVHLAHLGLPIRGDATYDGAEAPRLALHARTLVLAEGTRFEAPPPPDFLALRR